MGPAPRSRGLPRPAQSKAAFVSYEAGTIVYRAQSTALHVQLRG